MNPAVAACLAATFGMLGLLAHLTIGAKPIEILRATPAVAFAPADLHIEVRITPDQENRAIVVVCDGPTFYRSSGFTVNGDQGPTLYRIDWRELPAGEYEVVAVLQSQTAERGRATAHVVRAGS